MNIGLISGSPKDKDSSSEILLEDLSRLLPTEHTIQKFHFNKPVVTEQDINNLRNCSAWVFSFPLYTNGIPSHLLSCLKQLEQADCKGKDIRVYAISNCGFYEGTRNKYAIANMEIWCEKAGLTWGMGIGFGGGSGMVHLKSIPLGKGPKKNLGKSLSALSGAISEKASKDNHYITLNIPMFVYKLLAGGSWKKLIKANGGKVKDLDKRITAD